MPVRADDPLRRVTLNLYEADVQWLIKTYGDGWTVRIRHLIRQEVYNRQYEGRTMKAIPIRLTLGDLTDDQ